MNNFFNHLSYDINATLQKNTEYYLVESLDFLYTNRYLRRNKTIKLSCRVTAFTEDLVARDYKVTLYNMLKSFFVLNTGLLNYYSNSADYKPLVASSIAKFKYADIFYTYPNMLYHMAQDLLYRNIAIKLDPLNKQFDIPVFIKQVRSLNKLLFFSLFTRLKKISTNMPLFVTYKRYKNYKFTVWYLGVKFVIYNHYANILKSFFKKHIIQLQKDSLPSQLAKFNRSLLRNRYRKLKFIDKAYKFNTLTKDSVSYTSEETFASFPKYEKILTPLSTIAKKIVTSKDGKRHVKYKRSLRKILQKKFTVLKFLKNFSAYAKKQ